VIYAGYGGYGGFCNCFLTSKAGGEMPTRKLRLTKTEAQEYRTHLLRLEQMGIPIGYAGDPSPEVDRFSLEQIEHAAARIYELPSGAVAVVVPAKLTIRISGPLFTDQALRLPWDDFPLELSNLEENPYAQELITWSPHYSPPKILTRLLTSEVPLRPRQVQGVIVAEGWTDVPPKCHDESLVTVELLLRDERRNEFCFEFGVRLNRSLMRKYERRQQERYERMQPTKGSGLYGPSAGGQRGNQNTLSPEEAINLRNASGEGDRELHKPN
jgi:hypothetical protein